MITQEQLKALAPQAPPEPALLDAINNTLTRFDITSRMQIIHFLTQACFETRGFCNLVENLNYTHADRLVAVWPRHFSMTPGTEKAYAPDYINAPEKLANFIYANKNGNGDEATGDGWNFRGRGGFHLTFADNYRAASIALYQDTRFIDNPDLVLAYEDALSTAGWFWSTHGSKGMSMNELADADKFTALTTIVNGSAVTVPERLPLLHTAKAIF